jgi:hypothetical protein
MQYSSWDALLMRVPSICLLAARTKPVYELELKARATSRP